MGDEYEYDDGFDDDDGFLYVEDEYGFVVRSPNTSHHHGNLQPRVHLVQHSGTNVGPMLSLAHSPIGLRTTKYTSSNLY